MRRPHQAACGGALTDLEEQLIHKAAKTGAAVCTDATRWHLCPAQITADWVIIRAALRRFFEETYELRTGKPIDAARGLEDRMQVTRISSAERSHQDDNILPFHHGARVRWENFR